MFFCFIRGETTFPNKVIQFSKQTTVMVNENLKVLKKLTAKYPEDDNSEFSFFIIFLWDFSISDEENFINYEFQKITL